MTPCIPWQGSFYRDGYPAVYVPGRGMQRAHRVAYEEAHGPLQPGEVVRHTCDSPPCVNPLHLVSGSVAQNNADMVERGRHWTQRATHFGCGHPRSPENTGVRNRAKGWVECKTCKRKR